MMDRRLAAGYGLMLGLMLLVDVLVLPSAPAELSAEVFAGGEVRAQLSGFEFTTSFLGGLEMAGTIMHHGHEAAFSAVGDFRWSGVWRLVTLISEAWVVFEASGVTDTNVAIDVRGLLYTTRRSLVPLPKGELFVGDLYAIVRIDGERLPLGGEFFGMVDGGFVPPQPPSIAQLEGTGSFQLNGESLEEEVIGQPPPEIPLDDPSLSPEFLGYLIDVLGFTYPDSS